MLFKKIVAFYGRSLSGIRIEPQDDVIFCATDMRAVGDFRQKAIDDISAAKVFLLDGEAANYIDSFREDLGNDVESYLKEIGRVLSETEMPAELVWVEFDHQMLTTSRLKRGAKMEDDYTAEEFGIRGFLIDGRQSDTVKVTLFRTTGDQKIIDPLSHLTFERNSVNREGHMNTVHTHPHMVEFYNLQGTGDQLIPELLEQENADTSYDMAIPFVLFALLSSPDNGVILEDKASLTPKEAKTARKFGKTWLTDALRSHITIRVGPAARAHLQEKAERKAFEKRLQTDRSAPIEHWVSEHERRYKSGKVVLVKAHRRGTKIDPSIPTRVMGPRNQL